MKTYKVKLEDKAALLNRLEKAEVAVDSHDIGINLRVTLKSHSLVMKILKS